MMILAVIAGRDLKSMFRKRPDKQHWRFLLASSTLIVIGTAALYETAGTADHSARLGHPVHFWVVWLGVLLAAAAGGLLRGQKRTVLFPVIVICLAVVDAFGTFRATATTIVQRRDPEGIEQWRRIDAEHDGRLDLTAKGGWRVKAAAEARGAIRTNTNLPRKEAVLAGHAALRNRFHLRWAEHPILSAVATGKERFWFADHVAWVVPSDDTFDAFVARTEILGAPPLVLHLPDALRRAPKAGETRVTDLSDIVAINVLPAASMIPIVLEAYRPDELVFKVNVPTAGWLLVTDRWAQGWRATINGEPVVISGGDFIFRAIPARAGLNEVRFTYHPFGFPWLLIVSWGTLAAVGIWAARGVWCTLVRGEQVSDVSSF